MTDPQFLQWLAEQIVPYFGTEEIYQRIKDIALRMEDERRPTQDALPAFIVDKKPNFHG